MKTTKMSLANMQGQLSRTEMKNIMAGSGDDNMCPLLRCGGPCNVSTGQSGNCHSPASGPNVGKCFCTAVVVG